MMNIRRLIRNWLGITEQEKKAIYLFCEVRKLAQITEDIAYLCKLQNYERNKSNESSDRM